MDNLKYGDLVICIDNHKIEHVLTLYKKYSIEKITGYSEHDFIFIMNDRRYVEGYCYPRFVSLAEFRALKLKEIYK